MMNSTQHAMAAPVPADVDFPFTVMFTLLSLTWAGDFAWKCTHQGQGTEASSSLATYLAQHQDQACEDVAVRLADQAHGRWSHAITAACRCFVPILALLHCSGQLDLDLMIARYWTALYDWPAAHYPMMEACVAGASFYIWIKWFDLLGELSFTQRYRFDVQSSSRPGYEHDWLPRQYLSLPLYLAVVWLFHLVRTPQPLPLESPSALRLIVEVALGIWAYDFIFYWIHLAMHQGLPLGHEVHHEMTVFNKRESLLGRLVVNHSFLDGAAEVLVNILVQNLPLLLGMPKHKLSRFAHNVVVTYLLTESHCGLDLPWGSHRVLPQVFGGAYRHEMHHRLGKCCFHQFFCYLDDLLGFGPKKKAT